MSDRLTMERQRAGGLRASNDTYGDELTAGGWTDALALAVLPIHSRAF